MNYQDAGVDVALGDRFIDRIKTRIAETYDARTLAGVGGFAAIYAMDDERLLAAGTDGVGTKVKLAQQLGVHDTIGQDLVAMCVNDVLCTGARPLFFLDYLATGKLDLDVHGALVDGIARACKEAGCALIGGETAEMPGVYAEGVYDLAGFCVGEMRRTDWLESAPERSRVAPGQALLGLKSSGFHSNGYSLVRRLIEPHETELLTAALTPTRLYVKLIRAIMDRHPGLITGLAHITGGGFHNIPRMNEALGYAITTLPNDAWRPAHMNEIVARAGLETAAAYETFNMGVGLVIATAEPDLLTALLEGQGEAVLRLGEVQGGFEGLRLPV